MAKKKTTAPVEANGAAPVTEQPVTAPVATAEAEQAAEASAEGKENVDGDVAIPDAPADAPVTEAAPDAPADAPATEAAPDAPKADRKSIPVAGMSRVVPQTERMEPKTRVIIKLAERKALNNDVSLAQQVRLHKLPCVIAPWSDSVVDQYTVALKEASTKATIARFVSEADAKAWAEEQRFILK